MIVKKLKAVSYVEIILVLTIVGVISSIAIPSMKRHSQKTEFGALAKKAYFSINEAVDNAILTQGPMRNWVNLQGDYSKVWTNIICPSFAYLTKNDSTKSFLTKDKIYYKLSTFGANMLDVYVDLNTESLGPNKDGKDRHYFVIDMDKESVYPKPNSDTEALAKNNWVFTNELWYK